MTFDEWFKKEYEPAETYLNDLRQAFEAGLHADVHTDNSKVIAELEEKLANADYQLEGREVTIKELEAQNEKMKKYAKLLQDICVAIGNDPYMVWRGIEQRVLILWDKSEEAEGLKLADNILDRLLEIKPQEWAEIEKWEIKEND